MIRLLVAIGLMLGSMLLPAAQEEIVVADKLPNGTGPSLHILGVGQDAGFPQAGCYENRCNPAWENANQRQAATSLGVVDSQTQQLLLFEATPQLPSQLYHLHKIAQFSGFALKGVFLTHAHIGHYTGLMYFGHEAQGSRGVPVYAMPRMRDFLASNGPWSQLVDLTNIVLQPLKDKQSTKIGRVTVTPFLVPHRDEFSETVGYFIQGPSKRAVFIPDIDKWSKWDQSLSELIKTVDYAFLDATFYTHGELPNRDMSKVPHPLVTDTMSQLAELSDTDKAKVWFIHFNHTNPLLVKGSAAQQEVRDMGFNIAETGLEFSL